MSAVPDLVSNVVRTGSVDKTPCFLDPWVGPLLILDQEWAFRVESGVQNRDSHRFGKLGIRVDIERDREQQIVHPVFREGIPGRSLVRQSLRAHGNHLTLVPDPSGGLHQKSASSSLKARRGVGGLAIPTKVEPVSVA